MKERANIAGRRRISGLLSVFVLVALIAGCGGKGGTGEYRVGVVISLSGNNSPLGESEKRSLDLLLEKVNKSGGIRGRKIRFIYRDDQSEPSRANIAAGRLVRDYQVIGLIGGSSSGSTFAIKNVIEKMEIPTISMAARTDITEPPKKWLFSVAPSDGLVIEKTLIYIRDEMKITRIAVLHDSNAYGTGGADEVKDRASNYGIKIVAEESYGTLDPDMTAQLEKIVRASPEALLVWGTNPGPSIIAMNMRQLGMDIPLICSSGIASRAFIESAGEAAEGVVFAASRLLLPETIPHGSKWAKAVEAFRKDYNEKYHQDIDTFAAHGWDSGSIFVKALGSAGDERERVRSSIESLRNYPGIDGLFSYSPTDHAGLELDALVMVKIENGRWVQASP